MSSTSVIDVNAKSWERDVLRSEFPVVVEFWHQRCVWCLRLTPIYNELSNEYEGRLKFAKLNIFESHENQHLAIHYGVMGTPTLIFFCRGRPVDAIVGFRPRDQLKTEIDNILSRSKECIERSTPLPPA
ncbi:MAG: thioredoxin domain-containing protein [Candidatus Bathyarchaeia archaeon]